MLSASNRLIVALDVPCATDGAALAADLGDRVGFYKIGLQLLPIGGLDLARDLIAQNKRIFLDFKFHDIGQTVKNAVRSIVDVGADFLTVHAEEDGVAAAVEARGTTNLKILAVTVLTSIDQAQLTAIGYTQPLEELVLRRARLALNAGADGVVASAREAAALRRALGQDFIIVTPGIRSAGAEVHDQKRTVTPGEAIAAGADYLVVGREVTQAGDKAAAVRNIIAQIDAA